MTYEAFLDMPPPVSTVQHKGERVVFGRSGRAFVHHYTKKPQQRALDEYTRLLTADIKKRVNVDGIGTYSMFTTAIKVEINFYFPHPSNVAKRDRSKTFAKVTRPDVDNMAKGLLDCLSRVGLIQDDALIYDLRIRKFTVEEQNRGVYIRISDELGDLPESKEVKQQKDKANGKV